MNRFLTGSTLLKAALAGDQATLAAMATGNGADDEGLWYAIQTFIMVAHDHPKVVDRLREIQVSMPDKAQLAFATTIQAAQAGRPSLFQGGNATGQGLLLIALATALSEDDDAMIDAMLALQENA